MIVKAYVCAGEVVFNYNNWYEVGANLEGDVYRPLPVKEGYEEVYSIGCTYPTLTSWEYVIGVDCSMVTASFALRTYNLEGELVSWHDWPTINEEEYSPIWINGEPNPWEYIYLYFPKSYMPCVVENKDGVKVCLICGEEGLPYDQEVCPRCGKSSGLW